MAIAALVFLAAVATSASPAPSFAPSASATATVRILTPARVGSDLAPPRPGMAPRDTQLVQRDGSILRLRLYEFE